MLIVNICYTKFFYILYKLTNHKIITQIIQSYYSDDAMATIQNKDLWKLIFSNKTTKIARLSTRGYRSRWWLVLHFQTLDTKENYSIVISRLNYPKAVYRALSAHLWYYV